MCELKFKYDIGAKVVIKRNGADCIGVISGLSAHREADNRYSISYLVKWDENGKEMTQALMEDNVYEYNAN